MPRRTIKIIFILAILSFASIIVAFSIAWYYPPLGEELALPQYAVPFQSAWQVQTSPSVWSNGVINGPILFELSLVSFNNAESGTYPVQNGFQVSAKSMENGATLWASPRISSFTHFPVSPDANAGGTAIYVFDNSVAFVTFAHSVSFLNQTVSSPEYLQYVLILNGSNGNVVGSSFENIGNPTFESSTFSAGYGSEIYAGYFNNSNDGTLVMNSLSIESVIGKSSAPIPFKWQTVVTSLWTEIYQTLGGSGFDRILVGPTYVATVICYQGGEIGDGNGDGFIISLNPITGGIFWKGHPPNNPFGNYGTVGNMLFSSNNSTLYYASIEGPPAIYGIDMTSGQLIQNSTVPSALFLQSTGPFVFAPYYVSSVTKNVIAISGTNYTAFQQGSGRELWNIDLAQVLGGLGDQPALADPITFSNGLMLLSSYPSCAYCSGNFLNTFIVANISTGAVLWSHTSQINKYGPDYGVLASDGSYLVFTWYDHLVCANILSIT